MTNANDDVHPVVKPGFVYGDGSYEETTVKSGLTKHEFFAAHAPEIPTWFIHKQEQAPQKPTYNEATITEDDKAEIRQWLHDPIFDLSNHLSWYQDKWQEYNDECRVWEYKNTVSRFFQWRIFYAYNLIAELNKKNS
jgi:hypothetical protein